MGQEPEDYQAIKERIMASRHKEPEARVSPFHSHLGVERPKVIPFIADMRTFYGLR